MNHIIFLILLLTLFLELLGLSGISATITIKFLFLLLLKHLIKFELDIYILIILSSIIILIYFIAFSYIRMKVKKDVNSDMVGNKVEVINNKISKHKTGQVSWSGTIFLAELSKDTLDCAEIGQVLEIVETKGSILICKIIE